MKNKIKLIILSIAVLLFASCGEDFLDKSDLDDITSDSFWKTPNDLNLYVLKYYPNLPSWGINEWSGGIYWRDRNSDIQTHFNVDTRLAGQSTINTGNGNWDYGNIRSINIFFANYENVDADFSAISQYVGEAHFFRAWFYFDLLRNYGGVPWITTPLQPDSEELFAPRTSRDQLAMNIIEDIDKAIEFLPNGPVSNGNRLSKECAMIFKGRVALYEGTWEKYHEGTPFGVSGSNGNNFLQIAANTMETLINNPGSHGIYNTGNPDNDYWTLFNQTNFSGHPEVMLWRAYDRSLGIAHNGQRYLPRIGGGIGVTKAMIDSYLCTDGLPISVSDLYMGDQGLEQVSANRDPRLSQTIYLPGAPMEEVGGEIIEAFEKPPLGVGGEAGCPTGYMVFKGANPDPVQYSSGRVGTTSSPIFRFAEALLIYAEAKAELGTITQGDLDISINLLRERAGMPHLNMGNIVQDPNWDFPALSPIINEIRRERKVELAIEGYRFDDLMRWQAADELLVGKRNKGLYFIQEEFPELTVGSDVMLDANGYVDPLVGQVPNGFEFNINRDYLLPIPINELTLNSNLEQNPGW